MRKSISIPAVIALTFLAAGCTQLKSRDQINKGVSAFKSAQFPQAVEHFKTAVELEPQFTSARLYLAVAYMQQYVPGSEAPDNTKYAEEALNQFQKVLEQDQNNKTAAAYIATLMLNEKKLDEAEKWYQRVIQLDPKNADAYYSLGFIAWSKWYPAYAGAMHELKQAMDSPFPIKDKKVKAELKAKWDGVIQAGLENLDKCLVIDPLYGDAMAYENLLIRERAYLLDDQKQFDKDILTANAWIDKDMAAKKTLAEKKAKAAEANGIVQDVK
jgi:tetratricopeptide (TPR) repeat protein